MREISTVGVIGLGTMGAGIVEVFARGGLTVIGVETTQEFADRGRQILQRSTDRAVQRGRLDEAGQQQIMDRITISTELGDLAPADLVIEAVPEIMKIKHDVFTTLDGIVAADAILATNTSSLSVTDIAAPTAHPERVVGMHFFNPAPVLKLVEVITTVRTDAAVTQAIVDLSQKLGKNPVVVGDRAGFVANYLLFGYLTNALRMYEQGHVSREDLDTAVRVGIGLPMGPLTLTDLVGVDVCNAIGDVVYAHSRSPRHTPSSMLARMDAAGWHGRKSGRGFYTYAKPGSGELVADDLTPATAEPIAINGVGVVGAGEVADHLISVLTEGGHQVTHVADATDEQELTRLAGVDLVIEAQSGDADEALAESAGSDNAEWDEESADLEEGLRLADLFEQLGRITGEQTVLASVGVAPVAVLGALSGRPERTLALRIHEPTANGQVIEIAHSIAVEDSALALLRQVVKTIGAEPVVCRDRDGLVVDALLMPHLNDGVVMVDEGYASVADIDTAVKFGLGYPQGIFEMIDHIGADEVLAVLEELSDGNSGLPLDATDPSPRLVEHVILDRPFTS